MSREQKGMSLVLVSLIGAGLLMMTGVAGDVGMVLYTKHRMQTAADAAALAGARVLFFEGRSEAIQQARALSQINGYPIANSTVKVTNSDTRVEVTFTSPQSLVLGTLIRIPSVTVPVKASAERFIRRWGLRPTGIPELDPTDPVNSGFVPGDTYTLKEGSGGTIVKGNFQALSLDPNGANDYELGLKFAARQGWQVGDLAPTKPGNNSGPTKTGVVYVLSTPYHNIVVPLIDATMWRDVNGKDAVKIVAFAEFELVSAGSGTITAKFVRRLGVNEWPETITGSRLVE